MAGPQSQAVPPGAAPVRYHGRTLWLVWRPDRVEGLRLRALDRDRSRSLLRSMMLDEQNAAGLRRVLREAAPGAATGPAFDGPVIDHAARLLETGQIALIEPFEAPRKQHDLVPIVQQTAAPEETRAAAPRQKVKTWIKFKVVLDSSGQPVPSVRLRITKPDGIEDFYTTSGAGEIEIRDIERGTCEVRSELDGATIDNTLHLVSVTQDDKPADPESGEEPPAGAVRFLANVESHKVKKGESIDSLAKGAGLKWQALAKFNWGTDVPDEINEHLRDEVGCTKKTKDGYNYMFDDSDKPGIVYIPRAWSKEGLATGQTHVIRVRTVVRGVALRFVLKSETTGHLLPSHPFTVYDESGKQVADGKTDEQGEAAVSVPGAGEYEVVPGTDATYTVSGRVHRLKSQEPLANEEIDVRPWQAKAVKVRTGPKGEISLARIPHGELVLAYRGAEYSVYVAGDISDAFFFVPYQEEGAPPEEGEKELNV